MLNKGIHPTIIAEAFLKASAKAVEYLTEISVPINLDDNAALQRAATTSLNSKVISPVILMVIFHANGMLRSFRNTPPPLLRLPFKLSAVLLPKIPRMSICEIFVSLKRSAVPSKILNSLRVSFSTKTLLSPLGVRQEWKRPRLVSFSSN